jgi:3-oxoadipate enol-lactonase
MAGARYAVKPLERADRPMSWATLTDVALRYELSGWGPRSLVLIHELGGSLESFDVSVLLLERDFRILRFDQRGAGLSEKPRRAFTLEDQVDDLARLLAVSGLEPPYHIAGIAAGAAIAAAFALERPDLVAALALCAPALTVAPERRRYLSDRSEKAAREGMRAVVDQSLDRSYPAHLRGDGRIYEAYRARFLGNDPVAYGHANMALVRARLDTLLTRLKPPCLVLAGRYDLVRPPEQVRALVEHLPAARFATVESGHLMSVQAPDEFATRLRDFFLDPHRIASPIARAL